MHIPFVSLKKYDGQIIERPPEGSASQGGDQGMRWHLTTDAPSWAAGATAQIFKARNDRLTQVYQLDYPDINGLGNAIYRLDGNTLSFCLKVLGQAEGNERETAVWNVLGYGDKAAAEGRSSSPIKGLPPAKFTFLDKQLNTVLMPYYPGVLKAISGGSYEFPLVICAALYVEETLAGLHERGLAYMDLCPSNILFKTVTPKGPMLFFLTDMGGVKPLLGFENKPGMEALLSGMVSRRWTRREVLPPADLFAPHEPDPRLESTAAYDYYTLARTCQLLLGMGPEVEHFDTSHLSEGLCLEDPMRPQRSEIDAFRQCLQPWLSGNGPDLEARAQTRASLQELFRSFFKRRRRFAVSYLAESSCQPQWLELLEGRLERYRMALPAGEFPAFLDELNMLRPEETATVEEEQGYLQQLVTCLCEGRYEASLQHLAQFGQTRLVRESLVANYALFFHRKLMRGMFGGRAGLHDALAEVAPGLAEMQPRAEEPEASTCKAARREGPGLILGILKRTV